MTYEQLGFMAYKILKQFLLITNIIKNYYYYKIKLNYYIIIQFYYDKIIEL